LNSTLKAGELLTQDTMRVCDGILTLTAHLSSLGSESSRIEASL
jgi:hypothetical protein